MPLIRIEWVPIVTFSLGLFGFDHMQLVYQQDETGSQLRQEDWFVIEGTRDVTAHGVLAGVQGNDGRTTLAAANAASGRDLIEKIGTPEARGSRPIPFAGNEFNVWQSMAALGRDIEAQDYPYIAFGLPGSPLPAINSASVIASLLHYAGVEIAEHIPFGMRRSPGTTTLLGTSGDDVLRISGGFTTILSGRGNDTLSGSADAKKTDRLFGGAGDDTFRWSPGFNIVHGGQPELSYEQDGTDTIDYAGAGVVTLSVNETPVPHTTPQIVVTFAGGSDHLYSIERIKWGRDSDRVIVKPGVDVIEDGVILDLGPDAGGRGDTVDFAEAQRGLLIQASGLSELNAMAIGEGEPRGGLRLLSAEWIIGSEHDDTIAIGPGQRGVEGGGGDDMIDARLGAVDTGTSPHGYDVELDGGAGNDTLIVGRGRVSLTGGRGADRFVLAATAPRASAAEMVIEDAAPEDRLLVALELLDPARGGQVASAFEGDDLVIGPLLARGGGNAKVRIRHFTPGDLGIELPPWSEATTYLEGEDAAAHHLHSRLAEVR